MKAIILISSIFYILGLKLSDKIDLIKSHSTPAVKVITREDTECQPEKSIDFKEADALKPAKDSLQGGGSSNEILQYK